MFCYHKILLQNHTLQKNMERALLLGVCAWNSDRKLQKLSLFFSLKTKIKFKTLPACYYFSVLLVLLYFIWGILFLSWFWRDAEYFSFVRSSIWIKVGLSALSSMELNIFTICYSVTFIIENSFNNATAAYVIKGYFNCCFH